jgi:cardiolipin synthase
MAENVTATLHNIYTLRGTLIRDALIWSKFIGEALYRFGLEAEVMFASHHWPRRLFVSLVHAATRRVVLTTPYFIPDEPLLQAMQTAALRGVEVHLVVSEKGDHAIVALAQESYYEELLEAGIHIHLYRKNFLHAKHLSIDDSVALIGSSNLDIRSFALNAEVMLMIYDAGVAALLAAEQHRYFANSRLLTLANLRQRSFGKKCAQNLARLLSPLL